MSQEDNTSLEVNQEENSGHKMQAASETAEAATSTIVSFTASPTSSPTRVASSALEDRRRKEQEARTIFLSNVSSSTSPEELSTYFSDCGNVNHITMLCNRIDGHAKGLAYIEFSTKEAVPKALALNGQPFKERELKISMKRTNLSGVQSSEPFPRGSFHSRGQFRERGRRSCSPHGSPSISGSKSSDGFLG